ncbi:MAG: EamA-like transporter family protein, partial [Nitrospina sp.]|nr:EamA-like transporter family protein [Nitrospina sp.]
SVLMDHFGWFGFPIQKMSEARLLGILLLVGGFLLIRKH